MSRIPQPYGTWPSPISSDLLTSAQISLGELRVDSGRVYWTEGRPLEGGRVVIVREGSDVTPPGFNARTKAHEYGGGAYAVHAGTVFFSNFADQRIYRIDTGEAPRPITPAPPSPGSLRYADARLTPDGATIICVRERHEEGREAINELVALPADGSAEPRILTEGHDFYSSPRLSPDGRRLVWLTWDHPNMPWDGTELWEAGFSGDAGLSEIRKVAGGVAESIFQPEWSPEGILHYVSDRSGWWNLYSNSVPLKSMAAEFGLPQWVFGLSRYAFLGGGRIACIYSTDGLDHAAVLMPSTSALEPLPLPYTSYSDIRTDGNERVFLIAASASVASQVVVFDLHDGSTRVLKSSTTLSLDAEDLSAPEPIEYPTGKNRTAHALYYPPRNSKYTGPHGEKPPLVVMSHGGPTGAATSSLRLSQQFWTSRGFAVVDVNYGGSTGYGREYRERLKDAWGIVDVEDCIEAARYLAARGDVDAKRMAIRGGSAGGYTTLCALVFHNVFAAGASHFGVGDLAALALDTHKFESRYLDGLIGPYPEAAEIYRQRSPIHFADRISCPVILFQGLDDKVVPPAQAETFIAALQAKGLPFEYLSFAGEGHGFRQAETIRRVADAELQFYLRIFRLGDSQEV
jgi:dipeptidyl aminopeptidase/acylaminoacyl peptidase